MHVRRHTCLLALMGAYTVIQHEGGNSEPTTSCTQLLCIIGHMCPPTHTAVVYHWTHVSSHTHLLCILKLLPVLWCLVPLIWRERERERKREKEREREKHDKSSSQRQELHSFPRSRLLFPPLDCVFYDFDHMI